MSEMQNPGAVGTATRVPNGVPGQNAFGISRQRRPAQAPTAKPLRRIRPESWASLNAAIVKEHRTLALLKPDSPRIKPSLPKLRLREPA
jgi:hypothetical protein